MHTALWVATGVLAGLVLIAGLVKAVQPRDRLYASGLTYVEDFPAWFIRALGVAEVLGAVGLVLPGLVGTGQVLVPTSAVCLAVTMVGAVVVHLRRREAAKVAMPAFLLALAVFVAWGRLGAWPL
ncbi:DoxX family protein [Ornithinimicrobium sufpigmenti]|uniref:DoxX family protein n=1 Tax=Ornithinimicrobium sufpigmenti TaxID=2508882 RepID=UPI0010356E2A|nr:MULTISPECIES: DoxX family protein [unclassified Ornithinimicrobium]